jgi:hypothetical protein
VPIQRLNFRARRRIWYADKSGAYTPQDWWGRPDSNRGPERPRLSENDLKYQRSPNLTTFKDFCIVDLQLTESTAELHARLIKKFLKTLRNERARFRLQVAFIPLNSYCRKI